MKKRRRILTVSAVLLLIALIDFFLLRNMGDLEPAMVSGWRLFLTGFLSLLLALGNNSARWITVILCGLGALGGFISLAVLVVSGVLGESANIYLVWLGVVTAAYAYISWFLAFSPGVAREIRRISEKTL